MSRSKGVAMNERQWELYRLSVVETWSESPYKKAVSAAIEHKLMILGQPKNARVDPTPTQLSGAFKGKAGRKGTSNMDRCVDCGAKAAIYQNENKKAESER